MRKVRIVAVVIRLAEGHQVARQRGMLHLQLVGPDLQTLMLDDFRLEHVRATLAPRQRPRIGVPCAALQFLLLGRDRPLPLTGAAAPCQRKLTAADRRLSDNGARHTAEGTPRGHAKERWVVGQDNSA